MIDIIAEVAAIGRGVAQRSSDAGPVVVVTLSRSYRAPVADVWAALTDPDRVGRWFLPLTGDLVEGGTFQLEGNASGDILSCRPPGRLVLTFGGPASVVDLRLSRAGAETLLEFDHTVPVEMAGTAAGALYVGPGWDSALMGLAGFLAGEVSPDPVAAAAAPEAQAFGVQSVQAWADVVTASGTVGAETVVSARKVALEQFAPDIEHRR